MIHERLPIRGGNWNNGSQAGVFALNLNNARSNANANIGFRPALGERQKAAAYGLPLGTPSKGPAVLGQAPKNMNRPGRRSSQERRNLEPNLIEIQESLIHRTYQTGPYHRFFVYEPKKREIASLPLKDRVVQHALVSVIEPIFEDRFIDQSFACRVGKGAHLGADVVQGYIQKVKRAHGQVFALKADISKYFPSVCHDVLKRIVARKIVCPDTLWLINAIMDSAADVEALMPRGIPIGNLTSQMFANIYLNELDLFVKHTLREQFYVRYMDDFVIVGHDKKALHDHRKAIEDFLWAELGLRTNSKTQVFPVGDGGQALDFLGYRIWPTHRALRKDSIHRMKRKLRRMQKLYSLGELTLDDIEPVIASWVGHAKHADTYNLRFKILGGAAFVPPALSARRQ